MLTWCEPLYVSESMRPSAGIIRLRLNLGRRQRGYYLITLASNGTDLLDLLPVHLLRQEGFRLRLPPVVGLAKTRKEAVLLVKAMTEDCLKARGDADLRSFLCDAGRAQRR